MTAPGPEQTRSDSDRLQPTGAKSTNKSSFAATEGFLSPASPSSTLLTEIGELTRYRVLEELGSGGFGVVFKAWDAELERPVAVKLLKRGARQNQGAELLAEARTLASLDHPAIVPIFDLGRTRGDELFIVSKYIDGQSLKNWLHSNRPSFTVAAVFVARIAAALDYAHTRGIVHRDVKPGNILLTADGDPVLADFGLALRDTAAGSGDSFVGTPAYMSPEQARSEGHRVDGRSDIYSLGTVFYELLTGRLPFQSASHEELLDYVRSVEARPPRQIDRNVPPELERICLKALAKRAADRYPTAGDMGADLQAWLAERPAEADQVAGPVEAGLRNAAPSSGSLPPPMVVPHGLRSFDESDADFFLSLLPGARDRQGIPESVRFWKTRIESTDVGDAFRVGVLLGPSGSGKSSLVRAGLLPLLAEQVLVVAVDAAPLGLEERIRRRLVRAVPSLSDAASLHDAAVQIRQQGVPAPHTKVLLVIDQFEQWLNVNSQLQHTALGDALRQCDGVTLQVLLLVRDDFTLAITRFLDELEEPLLQNRNFAAIDLFGPEHAARVLEAFGRAYGVWEGEPSRENRRFIDQAVQGLAGSGRIVPVQLAALAEIIKQRPWTEATLRQLGGLPGIGVEFLEQRLAGPRSHPEVRLHLPLVRRLLRALLPAEESNIRGQSLSRSELLRSLGDALTADRLDKLLLLLDVEERLITPVSGSPDPSGDSTASDREPAYQLTHDYLVPSIRGWLTASERGTRSGRARLRLRELSDTWNARPVPQRLPTLLEWWTVRCLTRPAEWSLPEQKLMQATERRLLFQSAAVFGVLALLAFTAWQIFAARDSAALYSSLLTADTAEVPSIVSKLQAYQRQLTPRLQAEAQHAPQIFTAHRGDPDAIRRQLNVHLALAGQDTQAAQFVVEHVEQFAPEKLAAVAALLAPQREPAARWLWALVAAPQADRPPSKLLPAACLLAGLDGESPHWQAAAPHVARRLIAERPAMLHIWLAHLRPQRTRLTAELLRLLDKGESPLTAGERSQLFEAVAELADEADSLVAALERAEAAEMASLWVSVERQPDAVKAALLKRADRLTRGTATALSEPSGDLLAELRRWGGVTAQRWAYVTSCPQDEFDALAARLQTAGFAPVSLRPFASQGQVLVAAAFDRSSRPCHWQLDVPASEAASRCEAELTRGFALCDLAKYPSAGPAVQRFALLWERLDERNIGSRAIFQVTARQFEELGEQLSPRGFVLERCHSELNPAGHIAYCALWRRRSSRETSGNHKSRYAYAFGELLPGWNLSDVRLHFAAPDRRDGYAATYRLEAAEHEAESAVTDSDRSKALPQIVRCLLAAGNPRVAMDRLQSLPDGGTKHFYQGTAAARLGDADSLSQATQALEKLNPRVPAVTHLRVLAAVLEHRNDALPGLLAAFGEPSNADNQVRQIHALAVAAAATAEIQPERAANWRAEAWRRLDRLLQSGAAALPDLVVFDPAFDGLFPDSELTAMLARHGLNRRYDSVWQERPDFQARLVFDVSGPEHQRRAEQLSADHYQLACLDVRYDAHARQLVLASAWQRPVPTEDDAIDAAKRLARVSAAAARLRELDEARRIWGDAEGPEARAQLIEIAPSWLPIGQLLELARSADSAVEQRSAVLALGGAAPRELSPEQRQQLQSRIERWAAADDAALAAAARWCAKRWRIDVSAATAPSAQPPAAARNWYVNSIGQTMVVLDPPSQFLMGSPAWESDRVQKPGAEQLHWRRIGRRFSIAATETTVALFQEFLADPRIKKVYARQPFIFSERYAPTPDCPQTAVRWYDAVRFCQWLSERENLPEAEWCYPGIWELPEDQWQLSAALAQRRGYRLPTEAEWEYACRGGSTTARHYGNDRRLLSRYAWFLANADEQSHPVAQLMPNEFGLSDMLGNVFEWCHDRYANFEVPTADYLVEDRSATAAASAPRAVRGGSFETLARQVRCADRSVIAPTNYNYRLGFRIARTENPSAL